MVPKVEGPWDIFYMDQLLASLEAKHGVTRPILLHAILETAEGVMNVEADRRRPARACRGFRWARRTWPPAAP
jgi:citrate lyase beta subunit